MGERMSHRLVPKKKAPGPICTHPWWLQKLFTNPEEPQLCPNLNRWALWRRIPGHTLGLLCLELSLSLCLQHICMSSSELSSSRLMDATDVSREISSCSNRVLSALRGLLSLAVAWTQLKSHPVYQNARVKRDGFGQCLVTAQGKQMRKSSAINMSVLGPLVLKSLIGQFFHHYIL